jgi:hypothetical protein
MTSNARTVPVHAEFERFRTMVETDPPLFERLRAAETEEEFVHAAIELGRERGCMFGPTEVREALTRARRTWAERRLL